MTFLRGRDTLGTSDSSTANASPFGPRPSPAFGEKAVPHAIRRAQLELSELWPWQPDDGRAGRDGPVRTLPQRDEHPVEGDSRGRQARRAPIESTGAAKPMSSPRKGANFPVDPRRDVEKREALAKLRDEYARARTLGSARESHANLEWILGTRRGATQDPLGFETKAIEVVALWLQDLTMELDRRLPKPLPHRLEEADLSAHDARQLAAQKLREATERFLAAFPRQP